VATIATVIALIVLHRFEVHFISNGEQDEPAKRDS
jgi:hypothetical protein